MTRGENRSLLNMEEKRIALFDDLAFVSGGGEKPSDLVLDKAKEIGITIIEKSNEVDLEIRAKIKAVGLIISGLWN